MKLSIVATLYCSSPYIQEFVARVQKEASSLVGESFEIILVNDGSPDDSLQKAAALCNQNSSLKVIDLSKNFGHHKAMMTGLLHSKADLVFLIDSDLEEDPEWLGLFHRHMVARSCDVVYGVQASRKGGIFERISGEIFYWFLSKLTDQKIPKNFVTARLMSRSYVNGLVQHMEREVFMAGLWHITGFDQQEVMITKHSTSASTYSFRRKMALLVNSITAFSNAPLVAIFYIGIFIFCLACAYTSWLVFNWLYLARPLTGWTSLMASIWLLGGLIISIIGIVGIYLSKIFSEVKQRPYSIIRKIYGDDKKSN